MPWDNHPLIDGRLVGLSSFLSKKLARADSGLVWLSVDLAVLTFGLKFSRANYEELALKVPEILLNNHKDFTFFISTFNFSFAETGLYDVRDTPGASGALGSYLIKFFPSNRTKDAFYSFLVFGSESARFLARSYFTSVGDGSMFAEFVKGKGHAIAVGHHWSSMASYIHHSEYLSKVNYRFNKDFQGKLVDYLGICRPHHQSFYVRNKDLCQYSSVTIKGSAFLRDSGAISLDYLDLAEKCKVLVYTTEIHTTNDLIVSNLQSVEKNIVDYVPAGSNNRNVITLELGRRIYLQDLKGFI